MNSYNGNDFSNLSAAHILSILGVQFKEYRLKHNLTQQEVADKSGVSISTIHKFEKGVVNNISFSTFVELLRTVNAVDGLMDLLPVLPENPFVYKDMSMTNKRQRVKHSKKDSL